MKNFSPQIFVWAVVRVTAVTLSYVQWLGFRLKATSWAGPGMQWDWAWPKLIWMIAVKIFF